MSRVGDNTECKDNVGDGRESMEQVGLDSSLNSSPIILNTNRNHGDHHSSEDTSKGWDSISNRTPILG